MCLSQLLPSCAATRDKFAAIKSEPSKPDDTALRLPIVFRRSASDVIALFFSFFDRRADACGFPRFGDENAASPLSRCRTKCVMQYVSEARRDRHLTLVARSRMRSPFGVIVCACTMRVQTSAARENARALVMCFSRVTRGSTKRRPEKIL